MKSRERYENAIFTIRFLGAKVDKGGVSIYDFASSLLSIQRLINKAHLSMEGKLIKGAFPDKTSRQKISLTIGERRRNSDAFALIPLLADPLTINYLKQVAEYVASGLVSYYLGDVLNRIRNVDDDETPQFIGSIYADVVNIVNRIDAAGGVERIELGAPALSKNLVANFDSQNKKYIYSLVDEFYLGRTQVIKGNVYRLYPNSLFVTIRRSGTRKVNVFLSQENFDKIRYHQGHELNVSFTGRPRYKLGIESQIINEFEAESIKIEDEQ